MTLVSLVEAAVCAAPAATWEAVAISSATEATQAGHGRLESEYEAAGEPPSEKHTQDDADRSEHAHHDATEQGIEPAVEPDYGNHGDDDHIEHHQAVSYDQPTLNSHLVAEPGHSEPPNTLVGTRPYTVAVYRPFGRNPLPVRQVPAPPSPYTPRR